MTFWDFANNHAFAATFMVFAAAVLLFFALVLVEGITVNAFRSFLASRLGTSEKKADAHDKDDSEPLDEPEHEPERSEP